MRKLTLGLSALLALQLLLATGLYWYGRAGQQENESGPLLAFERADIDRMVIQDGKQTATLTRTQGKWTMPGLENLPADGSKLETTLDKLADLQIRWPVTTTTSSHERFEVAKDKYQRRVQLYHGNDLVADLLLGTSPGFRKVHGRRVGDDEVYALALNTYDFPATDKQWLDKTLLAATDLKTIKGPDYALQKQGEDWTLTTPADKGDLDQQKAEELDVALTSLQVTGLADKAPDFKAAEGVVAIDVSGGKDWSYQFLAADDKYYVRRSDREQVFTLSKYDYDRIAGVDLSALAPAPAVSATE